MFSRNTLFVVGAGASFEFGLPVGSELINNISNLYKYELDTFGRQPVRGDKSAFYAMDAAAKNCGMDLSHNDLFQAAKSISRAMPLSISIDNYIDAHKGNKAIEIAGKIAIARAILMAEQKSEIYTNSDDSNKIEISKIGGTWLLGFFKALTENVTWNNIIDSLEKVKIICFNYDRCIEYALSRALAVYYGKNLSEIFEVMGHLEIVHPYGTVGNMNGGDLRVGFGQADVSASNLYKLSTKIRTFTEVSYLETGSRKPISNAMEWAENLIFLGFAYHPINMGLLFPKEESGRELKLILGTSLGLSGRDTEIVRNQLRFSPEMKSRSEDIILEGIKCAPLMDNYIRSLTS